MSTNQKSAAELLAELQKDSRYQRKRKEIETNRDRVESELARDEETLLGDLAQAGISVQSVWDLVNSTQPYPEAVPVLLEHLRHSHHLRVREGIVRALTVPEARGIAFDPLYEQFVALREADAPELKWLLAAALAETTTTEAQARRLAVLLQQPQHGKARKMLRYARVHLPSGEQDRLPSTDDMS